MTAVFRREMGAYFHGVTGYLFMAFVLVFAGIYTMVYNLSGLYANFEYVLDAISFIYLIAVPVPPCARWRKKSGSARISYCIPCPSAW